MPEERTGYYDMFGLQMDATEEEIRKAYRKMVKKYHPDGNANREEAEKKLKRINKAYEVLGNPQKRARYDEINRFKFSKLQNEPEKSKVKEEIKFEKPIPKKGADVKINLDITFDQLRHGVKRSVQISFMGNCSACYGKDELLIKKCTVCGGEGKVKCYRKFEVNIPPNINDGHVMCFSEKGEEGEHGGKSGDLFIRISIQKGMDNKTKVPNKNFAQRETENKPKEPRRGSDIKGKMDITFKDSYYGVKQDVTLIIASHCTACKASRDEQPVPSCKVCDGSGEIKRFKSFRITIPAGINDGHIIRLAKKGEECKNGGENGDILIKISVQRHDIFVRKGDDVYVDIPITFLQSKIGGEIYVPGIDGSIFKYNLRPGMDTGTEISIEGKGFPSVKAPRVFGNLVFRLTQKYK